MLLTVRACVMILIIKSIATTGDTVEACHRRRHIARSLFYFSSRPFCPLSRLSSSLPTSAFLSMCQLLRPGEKKCQEPKGRREVNYHTPKFSRGEVQPFKRPRQRKKVLNNTGLPRCNSCRADSRGNLITMSSQTAALFSNEAGECARARPKVVTRMLRELFSDPN